MTAPSVAENTSNDDEATPNVTSPSSYALTLVGTASTNDDDDEFAQEMRQRTQQRKERQDAALAHLRVQVRRLEAALTAETKRRVQAVAAVQKQAADAVQEVSEQWKQVYQQEQTASQERLDILQKKVVDLEHQWQTDVQRLQGQIDSSAEHSQKTLSEVKEQMEKVESARVARQEQLIQQLDSLSEKYNAQWKTERQDRVESLHALTQRVQLQEDVRDAQVSALEGRFQEALQDLSEEVQQEAAQRQEQDQAIVAAFNKYTAQVQSSLSFVSGV